MDWEAAVVALGCLVMGSVFASLHVSLMEMSRSGLEELAAATRRPGAVARAKKIIADAPAHARAVALARIVCNLALAVSCVWMVASARGRENPGLLDGLLGVAGSALLLWVFSVTVAESIARHAPERFVLSLSRLVRAVHALQRPLAPVAGLVDGLVRWITGASTKDGAQHFEDEIMSVVEDSEREGQIDEREAEMIEAVVNFKSTTVGQIMTPRNEIEALQLTNNLGALTAFVRKARHSRIPVYRENLDDVVGFFYVKDLLRWLAGEGAHSGRGFDLRSILRPAIHVPETKTVRGLAEELVAKKVHVAVVADEYGGVAGLVSLEDIIEEVFGEIQDEYEKAEDEPPKIEVRGEEGATGGASAAGGLGPAGVPGGGAGGAAGGGSVEADARAYIEDINEALEPWGVSLPEADEYDTLGGFVLETLGRIPEQNESFEWGGGPGAGGGGRLRLTVLEATPTRVVKVRVLVRPEAAAAGGGGAVVTGGDAPLTQGEGESKIGA